MFSISSIGKLQKITKLFTLFYNPDDRAAFFEIFSPDPVKNQAVLPLILLHFDILVNRFRFKNFLCFLNCHQESCCKFPSPPVYW